MRIFSTTRRKLLTLAAVAGMVLVPVVGHGAHASFGPNRPTFTWANPASYITFNSITDNPDPSIGDERSFVSARDNASADKLTYSKSLPVVDNEEVLVRVYFHNNAAANLNLVAANTKVKVTLPGTADTNQSIAGDISASNSNPLDVNSTMDLSGSLPFTLSYEPGSAQLWTQYVTGVPVNDSIVTSGALIGSGGTDGLVPGCSQFSGFVTIKVRVHIVPPTVTFACSGMDVAEVDRTKFNVTAHATALNATVVSYTFTTKDGHNNVVDTKTVTTSALSAVYAFNQPNPDTYSVSAVVNTDHGSTNVGDCVKQITVNKENTPVFACNSLTLTTSANRTIQAKVSYQADNGATLQSVNYDFGDGNTFLTNSTSASHTYGKDGTFTVSATLTFNVGSTTQTARCSKAVTFTATPVVATKVLPNTGPGEDIAGLFAGASALGAAGHYLNARRSRR